MHTKWILIAFLILFAGSAYSQVKFEARVSKKQTRCERAFTCGF